MPRRRNPVPSYRLHKQSGQAVVTLPKSDGGRRDVLLGRYGSPESKAEYARLIAELKVAPEAGANANPAGATVNEVMLAFMRHAAQHYRGPDGRPTNEVVEYRLVVRAVRELYGHTLAKEFGPLALKAVRQKHVDAGLCRSQVNRRTSRVRLIFKWAASEELVPSAVSHALATVAGLQKGRSAAPDREPVRPVAEEDVRATLPHVRPVVARMIEVQLLAGMRPQDVCGLRPCDLDTTGEVWLYRPPLHKNAWRGKPRVIAIGPKAQAILKAAWPAGESDYFFSPRRTVAVLHAERSERRVTPKYASHMRRNTAKRVKGKRRPPADRYSTHSYNRAIERGVERANADRVRHQAECGPNLPSVKHWSPNQLRHTYGTTVRQKYGLEAAGAALGHSHMSATEVYAERDLGLAMKVAAELG